MDVLVTMIWHYTSVNVSKHQIVLLNDMHLYNYSFNFT